MMLGSLTTSASTSANASSAFVDRRQPRLIVLKLRNLIVLTISAAGTSTTAEASALSRNRTGSAWPVSRSGQAKTVAAITLAAAGDGIPTK